MKRHFSFILLSLIFLFLIGCGSTQTDTPAAVEAEPATVAEEPVEEPAEEIPEEPNYDIIPESYAYSLTVSINPLVELYFNSENQVNGIAFLNEDAVDAYKDLDLIGCSMEAGLDLLVTTASEKGYLKDDATVEVELAKVSDDAAEAVDTAILLNASQYINNTLDTMNADKEEPMSVSVELSVDKAVEETTGMSAPAVCPDCNGTRNNCSECGGTAIVNCKRCNNGIESCGTCGGTAVISCHGCHGAGSQTHNRGAEGNVTEVCNYCGGSGKMSCDACGGQGTFLCSWCKGELRHICPICWGEGVCPTCGGDGIV